MAEFEARLREEVKQSKPTNSVKKKEVKKSDEEKGGKSFYLG